MKKKKMKMRTLAFVKALPIDQQQLCDWLAVVCSHVARLWLWSPWLRSTVAVALVA